MAIKIVDLPIKNGWIFPVRYVNVYQRVATQHQNTTGFPSFVRKQNRWRRNIGLWMSTVEIWK